MIIPRRTKSYRRTLLVYFVAIFVVSVTGIITTLGLYAYHRFRLQQEALQQTESLRLALAQNLVIRSMQKPVIDLRYLADSQTMQDYLNSPSPQNTAKLQNDFINMSRQAGIYDQIRFIDQNGFERIRVNYNSGSPRTVDKQQLQDKSDRYYFRDALKLPTGLIYISKLDLNVENGVIERPYKPMIRIAMPLHKTSSDEKAGVLILNYMAANVLMHFQEAMAGSWGSPMLLDHAGNWLYRPWQGETWGYLRGTKDNGTFVSRFPQAWERVKHTNTGYLRTPQGLFTYTSLRPYVIAGHSGQNSKDNTRVWYIISRVDPAELTFSFWHAVRDNAVMTGWLLLVIALLSYVLAWLRSNHLENTRALSASQARYQNLFENMEQGYALLESLFGGDGKVRDFRYVRVNPAFERILGVRREDVIGRTILSLFPQTEDYWLETFAHVATTGQATRLEQYHSGFDRYFEITAASPEYGLVAVFFADVTVRKHAEEQQRQATTAFNNTMEAIIITDAEQKIIMVNSAYTRITGYEAQEVIGLTPRLHRSGRHDDEFYKSIWQKLNQTGQWQGEIWNRRKNGEIYPAWENISVVKNNQDQVSNYVSIFSDISVIKQAEARLSELAHHDYLTGLANRFAFNLNLEKAIDRAKRHQNKVALLFLDLDRFKLINDTLGHAAGDQMLQIISKRLLASVRGEDVVARLGGDEFTIILEEISQADDAAKLARKILSTVAEPMDLDDQEIVISTSIGLSIYPDNADNATDLARAADTAMYRAKARGGHTFEFYTRDLTEQAMQRLMTENSLRQALTREELRLYYQPQIDVSTGAICGAEALIRWQHPEHGLMLPDQFIHIAEESRLIELIGEWVIHKVCAQVRAWRDAGMPAMHIAINLSPRQIKFDSTIEIMQQAINLYNLKESDVLLELEITESFLQSKELIRRPLQQLRDLGIRIAIDDFGTGYSSLGLLKQLPIDTLKIDRTFLRNIPMDNNNKAISAAIISMGHSLGMRVVAEGIETAPQLNFLRQHACDWAQGFLFNEALPPDQFEKIYHQSSGCDAPRHGEYDKLQ